MDIKTKLLTLVDTLARKDDKESLALLREITFELHSSGFRVENLSLIELNEYIDEIQILLENRESSDEIIALPIRKLIDQD